VSELKPCQNCGQLVRVAPMVTEPGWGVFHECLIQAPTEAEAIAAWKAIHAHLLTHGYREQSVRYIRFGEPPADGLSTNHLDPQNPKKEIGVSCYPAIVYKGKLMPVLPDYNRMAAVDMEWLMDRPRFEIFGEEIGTGSDGEPLLKVTGYSLLGDALADLEATTRTSYREQSGGVEGEITYTLDGKVYTAKVPNCIGDECLRHGVDQIYRVFKVSPFGEKDIGMKYSDPIGEGDVFYSVPPATY